MTTQHLSPLTMLLSRHTRPREFISLFGGMAAAWSLAAHAQESATTRVTEPTTATLPQIEIARVKPVDRLPPDLRLSDKPIDLMKDLECRMLRLSVAPGRYQYARRRPSTSAMGSGENTLSPAAVGGIRHLRHERTQDRGEET